LAIHPRCGLLQALQAIPNQSDAIACLSLLFVGRAEGCPQLVKAATSSGANYEESQAAVSKSDFSNKVGISLKEMRESNYWIRLTIAIQDNHELWKPLEQESEELKKILGEIYSKTSKPR
jgi:four helix bundle protein